MSDIGTSKAKIGHRKLWLAMVMVMTVASQPYQPALRINYTPYRPSIESTSKTASFLSYLLVSLVLLCPRLEQPYLSENILGCARIPDF